MLVVPPQRKLSDAVFVLVAASDDPARVSRASREADLARHHLRDLLKKRELYGVAWDKGEE